MSELGDIQFEIGIIEDRIEQAKQDSSQSEGAIKAHMERLKSDVGIKTEKEITVFIDKGNEELAKEEEGIIENFEVIKNKYDERVQ